MGQAKHCKSQSHKLMVSVQVKVEGTYVGDHLIRVPRPSCTRPVLPQGLQQAVQVTTFPTLLGSTYTDLQEVTIVCMGYCGMVTGAVPANLRPMSTKPPEKLHWLQAVTLPCQASS
jgi:hypothetical protein